MGVHQFRIALRGACLDREIDEMHQCEQFHRGEIGRDLVRVHVAADHQDVGIGQQEEESFDQKDR